MSKQPGGGEGSVSAPYPFGPICYFEHGVITFNRRQTKAGGRR
ncbi:MAG: hypothetical protein QHJ81_02305 [Anaerolineae bacterium]|nr:hypothetical protein [Anaerolineae bacterium]